MDWVSVITMMFGGVVAALLLGVPIVFAFLLFNIIGAIFVLGGEVGLMQMVRNMQGAVGNYSLAPVVLFVFMGEVMLYTGIAVRAIDAIDKLFSRVPGRLSMIAVVGGTVFSSLSGSTIANTAILGKTLLPQMLQKGYAPSISMGPIMAIGGIAMLIPPSGLAVLLASLAEISVNQVLIAGIIPALLMAVAFFLYIGLRCMMNPKLAPSYDVDERSWGERLKPLFFDVFPLLTIFVAVVGSMVAGIATPTESAALGSLASIAVAACYRSLTIGSLLASVRGTLRFSAMILFIVCASTTFSQILAFSGATQTISQLVIDLDPSPLMLMVAMLLLLVVLGCFMDQVSMMMLTLPLFMPIVTLVGFNEVWFAVLMLIVLEISLCTPPFGMLLFVMQGVAPKGITIRQIYASVTPFVLIQFLFLALIVAIPALALWLPSVVL